MTTRRTVTQEKTVICPECGHKMNKIRRASYFCPDCVIEFTGFNYYHIDEKGILRKIDSARQENKQDQKVCNV